jgi:hypothetical protein
MTEQQDKGLPRDDTGRVTSDYEPTQLEIDTCRNAICREFGNNGTDGYYIRILKAIYAVAPVPPSVEALRIEADAMERALSLQETHLDKHVATIATLEATNAAQAEQLATACLMLSVGFGNAQQFAKICDQVQQEQEGDGEYGTAAAACAQRIREAIRGFAALQSSIPPEPQAGVELTDEDIREIIRVAVSEGRLSWLGYDLDENEKYTIPSLSPYHYQLARAIERALNQRQAVKAEPQGFDAEFLSKRLSRVAKLAGVRMPENFTHEQVVETAGTILGQIASVLESAAQGVPEGWVIVPKMLTSKMADAIRDAVENRQFISWPANCWENAIEVAPKLSAAPEQSESKG